MQITGNANPRCTIMNDNPLIHSQINGTTQTASLTLSLHFIISNGFVGTIKDKINILT